MEVIILGVALMLVGLFTAALAVVGSIFLAARAAYHWWTNV